MPPQKQIDSAVYFPARLVLKFNDLPRRITRVAVLLERRKLTDARSNLADGNRADGGLAPCPAGLRVTPELAANRPRQGSLTRIHDMK
jgi:hypothetical protein